MDVPTFFERASGKVSELIGNIREDQWDDPTPCSEWSVRELVRHMIYETLWVEPMLAGKTITEVGDQFEGDTLGDGPPAAWQAARDKALVAMKRPGTMDQTVHLSYGDKSGSYYGNEVSTDILIHSWDLARGTHGDDKLDPELVELVYNQTKDHDKDLRATGLFGDHVDVDPKADTQPKLLALFGRKA